MSKVLLLPNVHHLQLVKLTLPLCKVKYRIQVPLVLPDGASKRNPMRFTSSDLPAFDAYQHKTQTALAEIFDSSARSYKKSRNAFVAKSTASFGSLSSTSSALRVSSWSASSGTAPKLCICTASQLWRATQLCKTRVEARHWQPLSQPYQRNVSIWMSVLEDGDAMLM